MWGAQRIIACAAAVALAVVAVRWKAASSVRPDVRWTEVGGSVSWGSVDGGASPRICTTPLLTAAEALMAADIALSENPSNEPLRAFHPPIAGPPNEALRYRLRGAVEFSKRWAPGRTLRVRFVNGMPSLQARVLGVAKEWERYASVRLVQSSDDSAEIRVLFTTDADSWALLGTDALLRSHYEPTMQFGWLSSTSSEHELRQIVLHEFGHALGLIHEYQQPATDRGRIPWDVSRVTAFYHRVYGWDSTQIDRAVLSRYGANETQYAAPDARSIMRFAIPRELAAGNFEVGWNAELSDGDKDFIMRMYPRSVLNRGGVRARAILESLTTARGRRSQ